jgi:hypothetical protein
LHRTAVLPRSLHSTRLDQQPEKWLLQHTQTMLSSDEQRE